MVHGRSINLALSVRGRKALARVGLEQKILEHALPMRGRMLHDVNGRKRMVPYDANTNQVCIVFIFHVQNQKFPFVQLNRLRLRVQINNK